MLRQAQHERKLIKKSVGTTVRGERVDARQKYARSPSCFTGTLVMQFMGLGDVPLDQRDRVFHYSTLRAVTGAMVLIAIALGALVFGLVKNAWLAYYAAAVVAICLLIFQRLVTARFRSSNWLIRMTEHGLFVKFRSYLNHHFSDQDPTVVLLPYSEICSV
jgi:hypothetical protein